MRVGGALSFSDTQKIKKVLLESFAVALKMATSFQQHVKFVPGSTIRLRASTMTGGDRWRWSLSLSLSLSLSPQSDGLQ